MPTYYKPTERRGKRVIYRSVDPAESKSIIQQNVVVAIVVLIILFVGVAVATSK